MNSFENLEFAVLDTETTGLFPEGNDRVIEIAVVRVDSSGKLKTEFSSLVNPLRDVGPTRIHGITSGDVSDAPVFEDVAGDLVSALSGTIIVGHNVWFDKRFLETEFIRVGAETPTVPYLCTMSLASRLAGNLPSRKLEDCCRHFGFDIQGKHSALGDARAAAQILVAALEDLNHEELLELIKPAWKAIDPDAMNRWPKLASKGKALTRDAGAAIREEKQGSYIARLIAALPPIGNTEPPAEPYLDLLDKVLEDRRIDEKEFELLVSCARELNLNQARVHELHDKYLQDLLAIALADGTISPTEENDLNQVRLLLRIPADRYQALTKAAQSTSTDNKSKISVSSTNDLIGKSVCFTGELRSRIAGSPISRSKAESLASEAGMVICKSVTKKLDYLVVADSDSMSGKAKKARDYGTRVVAEPVFWKMIGCVVE